VTGAAKKRLADLAVCAVAVAVVWAIGVLWVVGPSWWLVGPALVGLGWVAVDYWAYWATL
jgi:hypothetical protein